MKNNYNVDVEHMSGPNGCAPECEACIPSHTPTPWKVGEEYEILGPNEKVVATTYHNRPEVEANAAFIVRAVNAHEELLEALRYVVDSGESYERVQEIAVQAIAKAEGRS